MASKTHISRSVNISIFQDKLIFVKISISCCLNFKLRFVNVSININASIWQSLCFLCLPYRQSPTRHHTRKPAVFQLMISAYRCNCKLIVCTCADANNSMWLVIITCIFSNNFCKNNYDCITEIIWLMINSVHRKTLCELMLTVPNPFIYTGPIRCHRCACRCPSTWRC